VPMQSCRSAAHGASVSNETEVLDLVSSLHINRNTARAHHRGQAFTSLARRSRIVGQLTRLHASPENDKLSKIYALASQASAQIIQRFANRRRLCDRVARMRGRHNPSVAPCCTDRSASARGGLFSSHCVIRWATVMRMLRALDLDLTDLAEEYPHHAD
jgi:hypothetical protein